MPSIDYNYILRIINDLNIDNNFINFVETGTWKGDTILKMEPYFQFLYTIEIEKELYDTVKSIYKGDKINFILGDSSYEISNISKSLQNNTIFFLDGHWSSGDTGKGEKDCPLYEELQSINDNFLFEGIVIIDDVRLFGKGPNNGNELVNWEDINEKHIINILKNRINKYFYTESQICENDRLVIYINKM